MKRKESFEGFVSKKWMEVDRVISRAREEVRGIVEEVAEEIRVRFGEDIKRVAKELDAVVELGVDSSDKNPAMCVPVLTVYKDGGDERKVRELCAERFGRWFSVARVKVVVAPRGAYMCKRKGLKWIFGVLEEKGGGGE